jgi:hypothetical protein
VQVVDDRPAVVVTQFNDQFLLAVALVHGAEPVDIAFVLKHLQDRVLDARRGHPHLRLAGFLPVANPRQQVSDGIGHAHF